MSFAPSSTRSVTVPGTSIATRADRRNHEAGSVSTFYRGEAGADKSGSRSEAFPSPTMEHFGFRCSEAGLSPARWSAGGRRKFDAQPDERCGEEASHSLDSPGSFNDVPSQR
jgi:hypothetical protein